MVYSLCIHKVVRIARPASCVRPTPDSPIHGDSPDCSLSPTDPGRDGSRKSKRILAYSPEPKGERVD
jgi:hypothetical protein